MHPLDSTTAHAAIITYLRLIQKCSNILLEFTLVKSCFGQKKNTVTSYQSTHSGRQPSWPYLKLIVTMDFAIQTIKGGKHMMSLYSSHQPLRNGIYLCFKKENVKATEFKKKFPFFLLFWSDKSVQFSNKETYKTPFRKKLEHTQQITYDFKDVENYFSSHNRRLVK